MRRLDWPERLAAFLQSARNEPFAYGTHDCCQFASRAVEAMTGENLAARWRYGSLLGAARHIRAAGSLEALVTQVLGSPVHPSQALRGDVVLATLEPGDTIGVCVGNDCAFAGDPTGVAFRSRALARLAWRVT